MMASVAKNMSRTKHSLAPLEMYIDLCLKEKDLEQMYHYLFLGSCWAAGKAPPHLSHCKRWRGHCFKIRTLLKKFSNSEAGLYPGGGTEFHPEAVHPGRFAPLLGKMSNVQKLSLRSWSLLLRNRTIRLFCSLPLRSSDCSTSRYLRMEGPSFLEGRLNQVSRCEDKHWLSNSEHIGKISKCIVCLLLYCEVW